MKNPISYFNGSILIPWVLFLFVALSSVWVYQAGGRSGELRGNVPHLLSSQPLPAKIFDIARTEVPPNPENFQARELSYLFDYLDLKFIVLCGKLGLAHFLSLTKYLFTLCIVLIFWHLFRQMGLPLAANALCLLLFLTASSVFNFVYFHRSAKVGVALGMSLFILWLYRVMSRPNSRPNLLQSALGFLVVSATAWFDPQGFFFMALAVPLMGFVSIRDRNSKLSFAFIPVLLACFVHAFYRYFAGPALMRSWFGYVLDHPMHSFAAGDFIRGPVMQRGIDSAEVVINYFRIFSGSLPFSLGLIGLCAILLFNVISPSGRAKKIDSLGLVMGLVTLGMVFMVYVMGIKYSRFVFQPRQIRGIYALPAIICFLFLWGFTVKRLFSRYAKVRYGVYALLVGIVASNIIHLPDHKRRMDEDFLGAHDGVAEMVSALRTLDRSVPGLPRTMWSDPFFESFRYPVTGKSHADISSLDLESSDPASHLDRLFKVIVSSNFEVRAPNALTEYAFRPPFLYRNIVVKEREEKKRVTKQRCVAFLSVFKGEANSPYSGLLENGTQFLLRLCANENEEPDMQLDIPIANGGMTILSTNAIGQTQGLKGLSERNQQGNLVNHPVAPERLYFLFNRKQSRFLSNKLPKPPGKMLFEVYASRDVDSPIRKIGTLVTTTWGLAIEENHLEALLGEQEKRLASLNLPP